MKLEINSQFEQALKLMEEGPGHVFITGKAGTGKSTLLKHFRENSKNAVVVLAPTGVAAVNIKGQTIHSFFRFRPDITPEKARKIASRLGADQELYKSLDAVVIDEISMVRADLFDCIDQFLRIARNKKKTPFGGVRLVLIGDMYQLPPVVSQHEKDIFSQYYTSPYFFAAEVYSSLQMTIIELEKVYRQKDERFVHLLNQIRSNSIDEKGVAELNQHCCNTDALADEDTATPHVVLTTTNAAADQVNSQKLSSIKAKCQSYEGEVKGNFSEKDFPTELSLELKLGAQVMLLNNDSVGRWVNGTLGQVIKFGKEEVELKLENGKEVTVQANRWDIFRYELDGGALQASVVGSFTQLPLKLAWALTIHKAQGKTFEKVVVDLGRGTFAHGQAYVALSRCTSLAGMRLCKPLQKRHVLVDQRVTQFLDSFQQS